MLTYRQDFPPQGRIVAFLSEIEAGKKPGSVEAYKALAEALDASVDWLVL